jgi:hypothetical protein
MGASAGAQIPPPCLPDVDGDGHPLFSTPLVITRNCLAPAPPRCATSLAHAAEIADLNGDGHPDLAVVHRWDEWIPAGFNVAMNKGDGVFTPGDYQQIEGSQLVDVAAIDLDFDGDADLAMVDLKANVVRIYVNDGTGGMVASLVLPVGVSPNAVIARDFNNDDRVDLLVLNSESDDFSMLLNAGGPGQPLLFLPEFRIEGSYIGKFAASEDFNGDGHLDVVVPDVQSFNMYHGDGTGGLSLASHTFFPENQEATTIVADDFNRDGWPDLAAAFVDSAYIAVWTNDGEGGFGVPAVYDISTQVAVNGGGGSAIFSLTVTSGDFNGDGWPDLATSFYWASWQIVGLINQADGSFAQKFIRTGVGGSSPYNHFIRARDLNADGLDDAIVCSDNLNLGQIWSLLSLPGRPLAGVEVNEEKGLLPDRSAYSPVYVSAANLDGDAALDLVGSHGDSAQSKNPGALLIHRNGTTPGGGRGESVSPSAFQKFSPRPTIGVDLDGDGIDEVLAGDLIEKTTFSEECRVIVFGVQGESLGVRQELPIHGYWPIEFAAGDVDNDGDQDIFLSCIQVKFGPPPCARVIARFDNVGLGNLAFAGYLLVDDSMDFSPFGGLVVSDLDGDGWLDVAGGASHALKNSPSVIRVFWNNGRGGLAPSTLQSLPAEVTSIVAHDFDGDGLQEILAMHRSLGFVSSGADLSGLRHIARRVFESKVIADESDMVEQFSIHIIDGAPKGHTWAVVDEELERVAVHELDKSMNLVSSVRYSGGQSFKISKPTKDLEGRLTIAVADNSAGTMGLLIDHRCAVISLPCPADCDGTGVLNIDDFICFQTSFVLGEPKADCDASGQLNIDDFICFQTKFVLGC